MATFHRHILMGLSAKKSKKYASVSRWDVKSFKKEIEKKKDDKEDRCVHLFISNSVAAFLCLISTFQKQSAPFSTSTLPEEDY